MDLDLNFTKRKANHQPLNILDILSKEEVEKGVDDTSHDPSCL
jgi:hypothetical protein